MLVFAPKIIFEHLMISWFNELLDESMRDHYISRAYYIGLGISFSHLRVNAHAAA